MKAMASGLGSYNIAISGLYVNERALDVTGHNISNVNTTGYVRQQVMIKNAPFFTVSYGNQIQQMGLGADLQQIRQIRNSFLDAMYRKENMTMGYWEARYKGVQEIESILADPMGEGLQDVMNDFWDAWQELSKEPESLTVRAIVRQRSQNLVHTINHIGSQLDKLIEDLSTEIKVRIDEVNNITSQIAELDVKISNEELAGGTANDYRDQRNLLADRLTKLINAEVSDTVEGHMYVTIEGFAVVKPNGNVELHVETEKQSGVYHKITIGKNGVEAPLNNGYIKGLIDTIQEVEDVKEMLNKLVSTMAEEVNKLHRSGKTAGEPPSDGQDFFVSAMAGQPITINNIKLNDNLKDLNNIVASTGGSSGDNTIALAISGLRNQPLINDKVGTLSLDEFYETVILAIGHSGREAFNILEGQTILVQSIDNNRQSLSGVSLDEEMTNMMKYKFAYDASSRVFNAIDNMIDIIINRMGIVGR